MKADLRVTNGVIATLTEGTRTSCITLADKTMLLMNYFHAKLENEKILF